MKKYKILFAMVALLVSCNEEAIIYDKINTEYESIYTESLPITNFKTVQEFPIRPPNSKLYFGDIKESENIFSLVQMTLFSGYLPPTNLMDILADSISVDSVVVYFFTQDSLDVDDVDLSLYSVLAEESDLFSSDSTNYYTLDNYIDFEQNSVLLNDISLSSIYPDSLGYDTLKFIFKDEKLQKLKDNFFDTDNNTARTFLLKTSDQLNELFSIEGASSYAAPKMRVWYTAAIDESTALDTFATFFSESDVSIFNPLSVNNDDLNFISINSGSGLKSIIEFDFSLIDSLARNELIKSSNLRLSIQSSNLTEDDNFFVVASALNDSITEWNYSTFTENDSISNIVIDSNFAISRKINDGSVEIPIQSFLNGYKNGLFKNNQLMIFSSSANSPFDKVLLNPEPIELIYVKP